MLKERVDISVVGFTKVEKVKFRQGNNLESWELVDVILIVGANYNFPKINLISHYE